jgi:hypothetical protein
VLVKVQLLPIPNQSLDGGGWSVLCSSPFTTWEDIYTFVSLISFAFNFVFEYVIMKVQVNQEGSLTPSSGEAILFYT